MFVLYFVVGLFLVLPVVEPRHRTLSAHTFT
jgi:hypothetical protein